MAKGGDVAGAVWGHGAGEPPSPLGGEEGSFEGLSSDGDDGGTDVATKAGHAFAIEVQVAYNALMKMVYVHWPLLSAVQFRPLVP